METYFTPPTDEWYHLAAFGEFPHKQSGFTQIIDDIAADAIIQDFKTKAEAEGFPGLLVDFDHQSLDIDKPSIAAGWIGDLEKREDGIYGKIRWSDVGAEAIEGGRYRFISPVWKPEDCTFFGDKELRPLRLMNSALTNDPNIKAMKPLTNRAAQARVLTIPGQPITNAFKSDDQRKAYWASRGVSSGGGGSASSSQGNSGMSPGTAKATRADGSTHYYGEETAPSGPTEPFQIPNLFKPYNPGTGESPFIARSAADKRATHEANLPDPATAGSLSNFPTPQNQTSNAETPPNAQDSGRVGASNKTAREIVQEAYDAHVAAGKDPKEFRYTPVQTRDHDTRLSLIGSVLEEAKAAREGVKKTLSKEPLSLNLRNVGAEVREAAAEGKGPNEIQRIRKEVEAHNKAVRELKAELKATARAVVGAGADSQKAFADALKKKQSDEYKKAQIARQAEERLGRNIASLEKLKLDEEGRKADLGPLTEQAMTKEDKQRKEAGLKAEETAAKEQQRAEEFKAREARYAEAARLKAQKEADLQREREARANSPEGKVASAKKKAEMPKLYHESLLRGDFDTAENLYPGADHRSRLKALVEITSGDNRKAADDFMNMNPMLPTKG